MSDFPNPSSDIPDYSPGSGRNDRDVIGVDGALLKLRWYTNQSHLAPVYSRPTASPKSIGTPCLLSAFLSSFLDAEALEHVGEPDLEGKGRHNAVITGIFGVHPISTSCFTITSN